MKTETEIRFEEYLNDAYELVNEQRFSVKDANKLIGLCQNMKIRYEEMKKSRDNWRKKYEELKKVSYN